MLSKRDIFDLIQGSLLVAAAVAKVEAEAFEWRDKCLEKNKRIATLESTLRVALDLLDHFVTGWEDGIACYESPEEFDGYVGNAFKPDDEMFNKACDLLNKERPRNLTEGAAQPNQLLEKIEALEAEKDAWQGRYYASEGKNKQLLEALRWALEWIDAVPKGTVLPTMPGFDRDYVDTLISKAGKQ